MPRRPVLDISQILAWADAFRQRHSRWPRRDDGMIEGGPGLTWCAVDQALMKGHRGLVKGQSLAKVLLAHRKRRHSQLVPQFTTAQILAWADAHKNRTGVWPMDQSGKIPEAPGETWNAVHKALCNGRRGLSGGSTLARFLEAQRGVRNHLAAPPLTADLILGWADAHRALKGDWPNRSSGVITGHPDETWAAMDAALAAGSRGLPGGDSLPRLLERERGVRNTHNLPPLTVEQIRSWAEAHKRRTGRWPVVKSGPIHDAPGETWASVNQALMLGRRGLPAGLSVYRVLAGCRESVLAGSGAQ